MAKKTSPPPESATVTLIDNRGMDFVWIEGCVIRNWIKRIGTTAFTIYAVLCTYDGSREAQDADGFADLTGLPPESVVKAMVRLDRHGLIRLEDGHSEQKFDYTLLNAPEAPEDKPKARPNVAEVVTEITRMDTHVS